MGRGPPPSNLAGRKAPPGGGGPGNLAGVKAPWVGARPRRPQHKFVESLLSVGASLMLTPEGILWKRTRGDQFLLDSLY